MRTTLELTEEAYRRAEGIARETERDLGDVVSDLILKAAPRELKVEMVDGWPTVSIGHRITTEDVRRLIDEDE